MQEKLVNVSLPEGNFDITVLVFDESDRKILYQIYNEWRSLCDNLVKFKARAVNLPEGLSESAFCLEMGFGRFIGSISGANTSFDCLDLKTSERIQVKACSVLPDLTSFGPKSVWDKIYFVDFCRKGKWDGTFDIYLLNNKDIYNHKVNADQTLRDQQLEGRRPRFSIYKELIQEKNIKPIKTATLKK
ncbi:MAG: Bsp6I family type II restriction endonuclease [Methanomicrobiales archaeon]